MSAAIGGSRVCLDHRGTARRFTCPYHAWTYNLDGSLFSARMMGSDFDKAANGLKPVPVEVFAGMIFVSFADRPSSFAQMRAELMPILAPFGLERTRIVHSRKLSGGGELEAVGRELQRMLSLRPGPSRIRAHASHPYGCRTGQTPERGDAATRAGSGDSHGLRRPRRGGLPAGVGGLYRKPPFASRRLSDRQPVGPTRGATSGQPRGP